MIVCGTSQKQNTQKKKNKPTTPLAKALINKITNDASNEENDGPSIYISHAEINTKKSVLLTVICI